MKCFLCQQRTGKRFCPGVKGYICAQCCGQAREVSIECPFECPYLQEAYRYEPQRAAPPAELAYKNHEVPDEFVREHQPFIAAIAMRLLQSASSQSLVDADLRAILDAMVRTWETTSSGLIYETVPENLPRVAIYRDAQKFIENYRKEETERKGMTTLRDGDVLRALVFLGRVAQAHDNRRPRGKSLLAFLRRTFPRIATDRQAPSLIVPGA